MSDWTQADIDKLGGDQSYKPAKTAKSNLSAVTRKDSNASKDKGGTPKVATAPPSETLTANEKNKRLPKTSRKTWDLDLTIQAITSSGLPCPIAEHRFHPVRRWRFDIAWEAQLIALEVEGGAYTRGRHTRGAGFVKDIEKYNTAAALGWVVLRCIPQWLPGKYGASIDGDLLDHLTRLLTARKAA